MGSGAFAAPSQPFQMSHQRGPPLVLLLELPQLCLRIAGSPQLLVSSFGAPQPVGGVRVIFALSLRNQSVRLLDAGADHPFRAMFDQSVRHSGDEVVVARMLVGYFGRRVPFLLFDQ